MTAGVPRVANASSAVSLATILTPANVVVSRVGKVKEAKRRTLLSQQNSVRFQVLQPPHVECQIVKKAQGGVTPRATGKGSTSVGPQQVAKKAGGTTQTRASLGVGAGRCL